MKQRLMDFFLNLEVSRIRVPSELGRDSAGAFFPSLQGVVKNSFQPGLTVYSGPDFLVTREATTNGCSFGPIGFDVIRRRHQNLVLPPPGRRRLSRHYARIRRPSALISPRGP